MSIKRQLPLKVLVRRRLFFGPPTFNVFFVWGIMKRVGNSLQLNSVSSFLHGPSIVFQPGKSAALSAAYQGHQGEPDFHVTADTKTWLGFLAKEKSVASVLLTTRVASTNS